MNNNQNNIEKEVLSEHEKEILRKKRIYRRKNMFDIFLIIVFIFILIEAFIGFVDLKDLSEGRDAKIYINKKYKEDEYSNKTIYNLGLYKIVVTNTTRTTKTALKPIFFKD